MKLIRSFMATLAAVVMLAAGVANALPLYDFREGDIVFSGSPVGQGEAIMAATASPYTHCGVVFLAPNGELKVLEAVQPIRVVSIKTFISNGEPKHFRARRLKNMSSLKDYVKARDWALQQLGKNYDELFQWGDQRLYCSELVWKVYQKAGIELCKPKRFQDYKLDHPVVKKVIEERYGHVEKLPKNELVVTPSDLFDSPLLVEVPKQP